MAVKVDVVRGQDGAITEISLVFGKPVTVACAVISLLSAGVAAYLLLASESGGNSNLTGGIAFAGLAIIFGFEVVRRAAQGGIKRFQLANQKGISFPHYPELGLVPWSAVSRFHLAPIHHLQISFGSTVLIADLKNPDQFIRKLDADNAMAPDKFQAPPFATVAGSLSYDVDLIRRMLGELQAQQHGFDVSHH